MFCLHGQAAFIQRFADKETRDAPQPKADSRKEDKGSKVEESHAATVAPIKDPFDDDQPGREVKLPPGDLKDIQLQMQLYHRVQKREAAGMESEKVDGRGSMLY